MNTESTAVISVEDQLKQRMALQRQTLQDMSGSRNFISFKGGQIIIDNQVVPNGELNCIILAVLNERTYYEGEYDANVPQVPACYSYNGQLPHDECSSPQHENCKGCEHNKWGSATRGKGKACRESARLALISTNAEFDQAQIYTASVPITSIGTVRDFVSRAGMQGKLVGQYNCLLSVKPDPKTFFKVTLTPLNGHGIDTGLVLQRMDEADAILSRPYPVFDDEEAPATPVSAKTGKAKY